jgi:hypothetical protein
MFDRLSTAGFQFPEPGWFLTLGIPYQGFVRRVLILPPAVISGAFAPILMGLASGNIPQTQTSTREYVARLFKCFVLALPVMLREQLLAARCDRAQFTVP